MNLSLTKIAQFCLLTFSLAAPLHFIEVYVFSDWEFLKFLLVLIGIDTILGIWKGWRSYKLSSEAFSRLFVKMLVYLAFLVLAHGLAHFTVEGEKNSLFGWFSSIAYSAIMVRESLSILENLSFINPHILPGWVMERLKNFDRNGPQPLT
jgi:toxin secretion/phage lysis holin